MKHEKAMRIINELTSFCYEQGGDECQIMLKYARETTSITITCPLPSVDEQEIERLAEELAVPRQYEMEQNYWELSGEMEQLSGELTLVGMMLDETEVGYRDGILSIHALRKE